MLIIWRFQGAVGVVKMCDLQTAWKTLNTFIKFSLCVIDEFLTCSVELPLLRFLFFLS